MHSNPEIEIFRAGDYGERGVYTDADLERMAADYNPALHEAPVTLDHAQSGPALGWVEALRRGGGSLFARLRGVGDRLRELLREGSYKKRSVELYPNFGESGGPYLRAVSFLGAAVPEVKGMADVAPEDCFADAGAARVAIELPQQDEAAVQEVSTPSEEPRAEEDSTPCNQRFAELAGRLRAAGRWQPAWEARGIERFFSGLEKAEAICFAEGETPLDAADWFETFLAALPPAVTLGESVAFAETGTPLSALERTPGGRMDPASLALDRAARVRMAAHPGENYAQALARCATA